MNKIKTKSIVLAAVIALVFFAVCGSDNFVQHKFAGRLPQNTALCRISALSGESGGRTEIVIDEAPTATFVKGGSWAIASLGLAVLGLGYSIFLGLGTVLKKAGGQNKDEAYSSAFTLRMLAIVMGAIMFLCFPLAENLSASEVVFANINTLILLAMFLVQMFFVLSMQLSLFKKQAKQT